MPSLHPNLIFCAQPEVARFWQELELGRDTSPAWREATAWIGTAAPQAVLPTENTCDGFESPDACRRFMQALINAERSRSLQTRGFTLQADFVKTLIILEADETGLTDASRGLAETAGQLAAPRTEHDLQTIILLLQYGAFAPALKEPIERLREAFMAKRYGAQFAPKILVAGDSDDQRTYCTPPHLQQLAAILAHFLLPHPDWTFLSPLEQKAGQVGAIGLRSIFWDRNRSIEIARRPHFVGFGSAWIDGDGFLPSEKLPSIPAKWPSHPVGWKDTVWQHLQAIWQRETLEHEKGSVDDRLQILIHDIQRTIEQRLQTEVEKSLHDVRRREKAINLNLNLVALIVQQALTAPLSHLAEAIELAGDQMRAELAEELRTYRQQGGGLTILRNWLADGTKRVKKSCGDFLLGESQESRFESRDMLGTARLYVDELMRIPDRRSLLGSCWILFVLLTTIAVGLGLYLRPGNPQAVFVMSLVVAALISFVIGWFGHWFYSTRAARRLADFLEATQKMVSTLAHHRIQLAASELLVAGTNAMSGQIQAQEEAMARAREALGGLFTDLPSPGESPPFLCRLDPLQTPVAETWQQAIRQASQDWATQIWSKVAIRDFPSNWTEFMTELARGHREHIQGTSSVFHLDHATVRLELGRTIWSSCIPLPLQAKPSEAFTERGDRQHILLFAPESWSASPDPSLKKIFPDNEFLVGAMKSEDPDGMALLRIRDDLPWEAFIK